MKMKEVEKRTEMTAANIRFYEQEGLISPKRNQENNYRDYSEEDIKKLNEIKKLRLLGISIGEIKELFAGSMVLSQVLENRIHQLDEEKRTLQLVRNVCEDALKKKLEVDNIDQMELDDRSADWQRRLAVILTEDIVKEQLTREQFNRHILGMLVYGYLLATVSFLLIRGQILGYCVKQYEDLYSGMDQPGGMYMGAFFSYMGVIGLGIMIAIMIITVCTANMKIHIVIFHISALIQAPTIVGFMIQKVQLCKGVCRVMPVMLFCVALYVLILGILGLKTEKVLMKVSASFLCWIVANVLSVGILLATQENGILIAVMAVVYAAITIVITLEWTFANADHKRFNRYGAVEASGMMMNIVGLLFDRNGRYGSRYNWRR